MKILGLYEQYPRRYGKSKKIIYTKDEFFHLVNRDNGYTDVFISLYHYNRLKDIDGISKIDSDSAIINKIFIDMDFKDWDSEEQLYEKIIKLNIILNKRNILRVWSFTGGGFHLYIYVKNRPEHKKFFCRNAIDFISKMVCGKETYKDESGFNKERRLWDPHCPPKLSQMVRVIGTYNPKRHFFCFSLTEKELTMGLDHIKKLGKKQRNKIHYIGKKLLNFNKTFDEAGILEKFSHVIELDTNSYPSELKELLLRFGLLFEETPLCMKPFFRENLDLNYTERYLLITYLYRCGLSEKEIKEVLKIILNPKKLYHCCGILKDNYIATINQKSRIETQIPDIISNDYYLSCSQIDNYGYCNPLCQIKDVLYYVS